jgi:hypothetical protein
MSDEAPRLSIVEPADAPRPEAIAARQSEPEGDNLSEQRAEERFETEKRWMVGLALSIVTLAGSGFYVGGQMGRQIEQNAEDIDRLGLSVSTISASTAADRTAAARVEERLDALSQSNRRIEAIVERLYLQQQERQQ